MVNTGNRTCFNLETLINYDVMEEKVKELADIFTKMVANANSFGDIWKNITPGRRAFALMKELPDTLAGEFDTPADKATLLGQMLDQMEETYTPRFCISVREYMQGLAPNDVDNNAKLAQLRDYIDLSLPMEEYCRKYHKHLKFDPVERTEEMENVIESVEREVAEELAGMHRGMGFCFAHWHTRKAALADRGIEWNSPARMNPGVIFD